MTYKLFHRTILLAALACAPLSIPAGEAHAEEPDFNRPLSRPWLGIILGGTDGTSVEVDIVLRTSPADEAELRAGDRVIAVDGEPVRTVGKLLALVRGKRINQSVDITFLRGEETLTRTLTLPASPSADEVARRHLVGAPAPRHALLPAGDTDATPLSESALEGQPYLIDFWATWCQACKLAEPRIATMAERHGDALRVLTVSDEEPQVVRDYLSSNDARHSPVYLDSERALTEAFLVRALPTYALVGADGNVVEVAFGVDELDRLEQAVDRMLPENAAPSPASESEATPKDAPDDASPDEDATP